MIKSYNCNVKIFSLVYIKSVRQGILIVKFYVNVGNNTYNLGLPPILKNLHPVLK